MSFCEAAVKNNTDVCASLRAAHYLSGMFRRWFTVARSVVYSDAAVCTDSHAALNGPRPPICFGCEWVFIEVVT